MWNRITDPPSSPGSTLCTSPTPSTWPCTMWPPSRAARVTGRSRFTACPSTSRRRLVRSIVSSDRSNARDAPSLPTTVRHTPFTAIDAPMSLSVGTTRHATVSRWPAIARTSPRSSTIPVNMGLQSDVGTEPLGRVERELKRFSDRREPAPTDHARSGDSTHEGGRDVQDGVVDQSVPNQTPRDGGAPFDEHPLDVSFPEVVQERGQRHGTGVVTLDDRHVGSRSGPLPDPSFGSEVGRDDQRRCR